MPKPETLKNGDLGNMYRFLGIGSMGAYNACRGSLLRRVHYGCSIKAASAALRARLELDFICTGSLRGIHGIEEIRLYEECVELIPEDEQDAAQAMWELQWEQKP